jgi:hypothetical protein
MNKDHHFIVSFNEGTGKWQWDTDVESARFEEGTIYNHDTSEWSSAYLGDGEYEPIEENLIDQLTHALGIMNIVNGVSEENYSLWILMITIVSVGRPSNGVL